MNRSSRRPLALLALASLVACSDEAGQALTVMSFNVLCAFCGGDEYDPYDARLFYMHDLFERHDPDLIGFQELTFQSDRDELMRHLPGHTAISFEKDGELFADATIAYRTSRFTELERGFYWLSPTPDVPYSIGFSGGMQLPRLLAWAIFADGLTGQRLYFATTHFDNNSPSQEKSAPLVIERSAPRAAIDPAIVTGDFNSQPADEAYRILTGLDGGAFFFTNAYDRAPDVSLDTNTTQSVELDADGRIDHIFTAGVAVGFAVTHFSIDHFRYGPSERFPSDHRAVIARFSVPPSAD